MSVLLEQEKTKCTQKSGRCFEKTAEQNNVPLEGAMKDIEEMIAIGMANARPEIRARWSAVPRAGGKTSARAEFIACITKLLPQE